jgi:hypothetical protein
MDHREEGIPVSTASEAAEQAGRLSPLDPVVELRIHCQAVIANVGATAVNRAQALIKMNEMLHWIRAQE